MTSGAPPAQEPPDVNQIGGAVVLSPCAAITTTDRLRRVSIATRLNRTGQWKGPYMK